MGLFARYSGPKDLVLTYLGSDQTTTGSGDTHTGMNFGTAAANRYIIACVGITNFAGYSGLTIGGISATLLSSAVSSFASSRSAIWMALVPTGTSGNVNLVGLGGTQACSVALYSVTDLISASPTDATSSFGASPLSMSLNASSGGVVIAMAYMTSGPPGPTAAWTGLNTVDLNLLYNGSVNQHSCGRKLVTAAGSQSLSVALSGSNGFSCCAASLR